MQCNTCGGTMIGDGYSVILHCEYADDTQYEYLAPDEEIVFCTPWIDEPSTTELS